MRTSGGQWDGNNTAAPAAGCHHDFAQVAVASSKATADAANSAYLQDRQRFPFGGAGHSSPMVAQPKLKVGQPGDKYEQEADRVADQILLMPESRFPQKNGPDHEATPERVSALVHEEVCSPGRSLEPATRRFMESRFGHDFSQVRVHTGARAAAAAQAVQAQAFTLGRDVVFGAGQYAPETMRGKRLLAHELTHVMQQSGRPTREGAKISQTSAFYLQRKPDVGFIVHSLTRERGHLADPDQATPPGTVAWPLSFDVTSPLEAEADVEVTGNAGDPCASHQIGFLQTVHSHWLHFYYWGQSPGDGSTIVRYSVPLPIRDGESGIFWYASTAHETPAGCNTHVNPGMDDYPTIFTLDKVHMNASTGQPNYLTGVRRGIAFVTTLVASGPAGVQPLRFFYWNYQMEIDFRPDYNDPNAEWPFEWKKNTANLGRVHHGADPTVPIFTNPTPPFNQSLNMNVTERT